MKHDNENSWVLVDPVTGKAFCEIHSETAPAPFDGTHFVNQRTGQCCICARNIFKEGADVKCAEFVAMRPSEYLPTLNKKITIQ